MPKAISHKGTVTLHGSAVYHRLTFHREIAKAVQYLIEKTRVFAYNMHMTKIPIATGVLHTVPADIKEALTSNPDVLEKWNSLTPLARNEWICWTTIVKQEETRADHVSQILSRLREGVRQPCCWPGCPHRRPKARKWFGKLKD